MPRRHHVIADTRGAKRRHAAMASAVQGDHGPASRLAVRPPHVRPALATLRRAVLIDREESRSDVFESERRAFAPL